MVTKLKIAMLMTAMAVAGWVPLKEHKAAIVKSIHATVISSVVEAQREAALDQSTHRKADPVSPRRQPEKARRLAAASSRVIERKPVKTFIAIRIDDEHKVRSHDCAAERIEPVFDERLAFLIGS